MFLFRLPRCFASLRTFSSSVPCLTYFLARLSGATCGYRCPAIATGYNEARLLALSHSLVTVTKEATRVLGNDMVAAPFSLACRGVAGIEMRRSFQVKYEENSCLVGRAVHNGLCKLQRSQTDKPARNGQQHHLQSAQPVQGLVWKLGHGCTVRSR